jgi:hypothetical protein
MIALTVGFGVPIRGRSRTERIRIEVAHSWQFAANQHINQVSQ